MSITFNQIYINEEMLPIYIYIYIYEARKHLLDINEEIVYLEQENFSSL